MAVKVVEVTVEVVVSVVKIVLGGVVEVPVLVLESVVDVGVEVVVDGVLLVVVVVVVVAVVGDTNSPHNSATNCNLREHFALTPFLCTFLPFADDFRKHLCLFLGINVKWEHSARSRHFRAQSDGELTGGMPLGRSFP